MKNELYKTCSSIDGFIQYLQHSASHMHEEYFSFCRINPLSFQSYNFLKRSFTSTWDIPNCYCFPSGLFRVWISHYVEKKVCVYLIKIHEANDLFFVVNEKINPEIFHWFFNNILSWKTISRIWEEQCIKYIFTGQTGYDKVNILFWT